MDLKSKKNNKNHKEEIGRSRRSFLKKTAYAAPTLIAMGGLTYPTRSRADLPDPDGPPPSAPATPTGGWSNG